MNVERFEDVLRQYLRRKPFLPFVVELIDGRSITIEEPQLAIGGGSAALLTPHDDFVEFTCAEVKAIHEVVHGTIA